jgi:hypothetical protein
MKKLGLLVVLILTASLGIAGFAAAATGPVAHWRFNEGGGSTAADATGNGNTGSLEGGVTWIAGKRLGAVQFDGSTGLVRIPSNASLQPAAVSVSTWVKRSGSPGNFKYIVGKGAFGCEAASYGLYTGPNGGLVFYVGDGSDFTRSTDAGSGVWDGSWHHIAGTFDGQTVRMYVDGTEVGGGVPRTTPISYTSQDPADLLLGAYGGCSLAYDGAIDETKIWNRALSPSEVVDDMHFEFKGFLAPVDNLPYVNVAKAGSAVPLKFSLTGYQGMDILGAGSPSSRAVSCDSSAPPDDLELTVTPGSSALSYDAKADTYSYVWKTDKSWSGCRELVLRLSDGSVHTANFRFK